MGQNEIGEKIKKLRLQRNMTQSELAGDLITRNMLSRVEHGAALPSLPTVWYLAERLGVPAGFLLAEGDDDRLWRKMSRIDSIRRVLRAGDYRICLGLCREECEAGQADDEIELIMAECALAVATEEFDMGHLHRCVSALEEAVDHAAHTLYDTGVIRQRVALYFRFMRSISASLYTESIPEVDDPLLGATDPFGRYVLAREALEAGDEGRVVAYLRRRDENDHWQSHLRARRDVLRGRYADAEQALRHLLHADATRSAVLLYCIFSDLEVACREQSDFRGAYEYSQNKVAQLEKLLGE